MKHFIDSVQEYIDNNFADLQKVETIVPNNRTGSALLSSLKKTVTEVCWAPKITQIKDIFIRNTKLHEAEDIVLVYVLYNVYKKYFTGTTTDSFDNFYNFGEVLLSDFDDIDKYLVAPDKLFSNIADEKEIDVKFADIDENLIKILESFWQNVSASSVLDNKRKILELWQKMPEIYADFIGELREKGIGYQGMIYRDFVENRMQDVDFDSENYAFVGFSALNKCEKSLMRHIRNLTNKRNGRCLFFWDADKYYIANHEQEAGLFLRTDLEEFPLPDGFSMSDSIADLYTRDIQTIEVPTSVAQVKLIPDLLAKYEKLDGNTAIILGDEKLLVPLIYTLPNNLQYNITMGYPLSYTASASFVQIVMKLAMHRSKNQSQGSVYFNRKDILATIMHSFSRGYIDEALTNEINAELLRSKIDYVNIENIRPQIDSCPMLQVLFDTKAMDESFPAYIISVCKFVYENVLYGDRYHNEPDFMHKIITLYTSFLNLLGSDIAFDRDSMYNKLMTSMIKKSNMTFNDKSDDNLQILGFMETRSLDFDNVIMLSMNEDTFPKSNYKDSMIPYNLRKAFSMPSIEFQNSIFAYYFYRLLQRSSSIRILYSTEGKVSHAEKSRFVTQIEYELRTLADTEENNFHTTKSYEIRPSYTQIIEIGKTDDTIAKIKNLLGSNDKSLPVETRKGATPNLINAYIKCPVGFFFKYIENISEEKGIDEDTSAADFGTLLHDTCYFLYKDYIGKMVNKDDFKGIKSDGNITRAIRYAVCKVFNVDPDDSQMLDKAMANIMIKPLRKYVRNILKSDEDYAPFTIIDLENQNIKEKTGKEKSCYTIEYSVNDETVNLKGIIDRIDLKEGVLRVIDYKTSSIDDKKKTYDANFWDRKKFNTKEAVQVLIYSEIMAQLKPYKVKPCIISVTNLDDYSLKYKVPGEKKEKSVAIESYQDTEAFISDEFVNLRDNFNAHMKGILAEMLNKEKSFTQTENEMNCAYCSYNGICNRRSPKDNNN